MPQRRLLLSLTLTATAVLTASAVYLWLRGDDASNRSRDPASWATYTNRDQGYGIDYPKDWELTVEPTKCDSEQPQFCIQSIEVRQPAEGEVYVFVNFQGGFECWPVGAVVVSGYSGREFRCPGFTIRSSWGVGSVIRVFEAVKGKLNYLVLGQAVTDLSIVEEIVRSFRFVE